MRIFARHASDAFNLRLGRELDELAWDVRGVLGDRLVALVLGGGYGRGEGGVVVRDDDESPYNDLDLFLVVRDGAVVDPRVLDAVLEVHAERLGIHVDASRPVRLGEVSRLPPALLWLDLFDGHVVLDGPADVLSSRAPRWLSRPLPPVEALRLLLNRGAGLLWALRVDRGHEAAPDPEFVRRNAYKAALALGDATLILHRRYQPPCEGRNALLRDLAAANPAVRALGVEAWHAEALAFKRRPDLAPRGAWETGDLQEVARAFVRVFLHVERERHHRTFADGQAYAAWRGNRERGERGAVRFALDLARNARRGRLSARSPRNPLYRVLPALLDPGAWGDPGWPDATARWLVDWRRLT